MNNKRLIIKLFIILILLVTGLVTGIGYVWAIKLESNALVNGLVKMFPTLNDKKGPYIDIKLFRKFFSKPVNL